MDDITIRIGKWTWDLRANKTYNCQLLMRIDDPLLEVTLEKWCEEHLYCNTELVIGGKLYEWLDDGLGKVFKPKYVIKHIMYCLDLHRSFYELS